MKFKLSIILIFILLCSLGVNAADFDLQKAYDWLDSHSDTNSTSTIEQSVSALALHAAGSSYGTSNINYLNDQRTSNGCWPSSSCLTKDTSFAILALNDFGDDIETSSEWMTNAQKGASLKGKWYLQIDTSSTGTCYASYYKGEKNVSKKIAVDAGAFTGCGGTTWFDLGKCLESGLLVNYPNIVISVDCSDLDSVDLISLTYNNGNEYYLMNSVNNRVADLTINNGCYGKTEKSTCDYSSSLYAGWMLKEIKSNVNVNIYLIENRNKVNNEHNALLYIITGDELYLSELIDRQRPDGSWDGDIYKTALGVIALKNTDYSEEFSSAMEWLKGKQNADGGYGSVLNTGMVLYAINIGGTVILPSCDDGIKNHGEDGIDCGGSCIKECDSTEDKTTTEDKTGGSDCNKDGTCDKSWGETYLNCPSDCSCGDSICDNDEIENNNCAEDCETTENTTDTTTVAEEKSSFPWGTMIFILVLGIAGLGFYMYLKGKKGKGGDSGKKSGGFLSGLFGSKKKTTEKVDYTSFPAKSSGGNPVFGRFSKGGLFGKKDDVDDELEKSINEANKLIKGK